MRTYFYQINYRMHIRKQFEKVIVLASDFIQQTKKQTVDGGGMETQLMLQTPCWFILFMVTIIFLEMTVQLYRRGHSFPSL